MPKALGVPLSGLAAWLGQRGGFQPELQSWLELFQVSLPKIACASCLCGTQSNAALMAPGSTNGRAPACLQVSSKSLGTSKPEVIELVDNGYW